MVMGIELSFDRPDFHPVKSIHWLVTWPLVAVVLGLCGSVGWVKMIVNVILATIW